MLVPMKIDYGVRILVHLATLPKNSIVKGSEISKARHVPENFLFQISNDLIEKNFIRSVRGPNGGYVLEKNPSEISIASIIRGLDKTMAPVSCIEFPDLCQVSGQCSQQDMWTDVEKVLISKLETVTVKDLADKDKVFVSTKAINRN
jgi:Rrf2 family protein